MGELIAEFSIKGLPELPNRNMYKHWAVRRKAAVKWKNLVLAECLKLGINELWLTSAALTFVRHSSREPDGDNLQMSFKAARDGLVAAGVIVDDSPKVIGKPDYLWQRRPPKQGGMITIRIERA